MIVCLLLTASDSLELELLAGGRAGVPPLKATVALYCQTVSAARYSFFNYEFFFFKKSDEVLSV